MKKYAKYYNKNIKQTGGNIILDNARKYHSAYKNFIQNGPPLDLIKEFGSFNLKGRIEIDIIGGFKNLEKHRSVECQKNVTQSQFFNTLVNVYNSVENHFDLNVKNIESDNMYNFFIETGKSLLKNTLYNCIKYKYYDLNSTNHIDKTHNIHKYTKNSNINDYKNKSLEEIKNIIDSSSHFINIQKNIIKVFGHYDDIFDDTYVDDLFYVIYIYIKCKKITDCFSKENFDLSHLYKYKFTQLNSPNQIINDLYDRIKYIYLPLSIYTYDSDLLYEMNNILIKMYNPITNDEEYFNNNFVKLSFIILYCLKIIKEMKNNNNCKETISTTINNFPYKPSSSYCYRGIFIDKSNFSIEKLSYQVKINSFSREPIGVKEVLEFYYDKKYSFTPEETKNNLLLILYIAKNDENFIPIQFFNSQLKTAENEKEVATLPYVKYNCKLIFSYDKSTKTINNNHNPDIYLNLEIDLEAIHKEFFTKISEKEFDLRVYYIENIENIENI
jgi:hypothetical protein